MKFSVISKIVVTSMLLASTSMVFARSNVFYKGENVSYKGEYTNYPDYKDEGFCTPPDGFYVGAQGGYDSYRIKQKITGIGTFSAIGSVTGWMGGLFAGYGRYINNFYLGGELLGNYDGASNKTLSANDNAGDVVSQKIKVNATWGASLIPGLRINDTSLAYLRLGYDWSNFKVTDAGTSALADASFSFSKSVTKGGWDLGVGMETLICGNFSIRGEYNHVWYKSFSANTIVTSQEFKPSDNQFAVGALYHFT